MSATASPKDCILVCGCLKLAEEVETYEINKEKTRKPHLRASKRQLSVL